MKVLEKLYLSSQKEEVESIPDFLPLSTAYTSGEKSKPSPMYVAEIDFIITETTSVNAATPFGILIKLYRRRPVYRRVLVGHRTLKLLIGYRYELHRVIYLPPICSTEVFDLPRFLLDYIDGLENFLLPPPR